MVVNPYQGDMMLAHPWHRPVARSPTPMDPSPAGTADGSPSRHILPSMSPIPLAQPGEPSGRLRFKLMVIPHTPEIDTVEGVLGNALVVVIGGTRPTVSLS
jgi:hypothetical protein